MEGIARPILEDFLAYGEQAPSSHNTKVWQPIIKEGEGKIVLTLNPQALLQQVDPQQREAWISLGAFVQNLLFIARDRGYQGKVKLEAATGLCTSSVTVTSSTSTRDRETEARDKVDALAETKSGAVSISFHYDGQQEAYQALLAKRHTTRKPFNTSPIPGIEKLIVEEANLHYLPQGSKDFETLVRLSQLANQQQLENYHKRVELAEWINFAQDRSQGLNLQALGMSAVERFIFSKLIGRKCFISSTIVRKLLVKQSNSLYPAGAGYILITSPNDNAISDNAISDLDQKGKDTIRQDRVIKDKAVSSKIQAWLQAGMLLERLWITLTREDIAVHPMSQVLEEEPYYSDLKQALASDAEIQMVLRVGKL